MKKKRMNKRILYTILCIIIISICSLTIAYSVVSSTLTIGGSSEVVGSSWNISISKVNLDERFPNSVWLTGVISDVFGIHENNSLLINGGKVLSSGTISGTSVKDIELSFTKPGDGAAIVYEVKNNGTIPAFIDSFVENEINISSSTNNNSDLELISDNFSIVFYAAYTDKISDSGIPEDSPIDDFLCPGDAFYFVFINELSMSTPAVPSSNVKISNIGGTINFVQADKNVCSSS